MMDEFIQEGYKNKDGKLLKYGDDLPRAYTTKQRNSIKELSDTMYGCYDHELKMKAEHTIYGLLFLSVTFEPLAYNDNVAVIVAAAGIVKMLKSTTMSPP